MEHDENNTTKVAKVTLEFNVDNDDFRAVLVSKECEAVSESLVEVFDSAPVNEAIMNIAGELVKEMSNLLHADNTPLEPVEVPNNVHKLH